LQGKPTGDNFDGRFNVSVAVGYRISRLSLDECCHDFQPEVYP
jgi:hypothetical protein